MEINRKWHMPNRDTYSIKPIRELIEKYYGIEMAKKKTMEMVMGADPFCGNSPFKHLYATNDLNPDIDADFHLEATEFLGYFDTKSVDLLLYDPVYSVRQLSEVYKKLGRSVTSETTRSDYWTKQKHIISDILKKDGHVISFGWNSGGIGKTNGFEIVEILLVPHGGIHHDTICTVEKKL